MTEAWLLFDEPAIRKAAGNPKGKEKLELPPLDQCESLPDPKQVLHRALLSACGLSGRRRAKFEEQEVKRAVHLVPRYVDSFEPLRALPAFRSTFENMGAVLPSLPR